MAIRKPALSVKEARRLASRRSAETVEVSESKNHNGLAKYEMPVAPEKPIEGRAFSKPVSEEQRDEVSSPLPKVAPHSRQSGIPQKTLPAQVRQVLRDSSLDVLTGYSVRGHSNAPPRKLQVFLSASIPAPGISPTYELLCQRHSPQKSLQMILRKALASYERLLRDGSFVNAVEDYPVDGTGEAGNAVQTSRMMPSELVAVARGHFDPLGFESARAFGRRLGTAALAAFFARERTESEEP